MDELRDLLPEQALAELTALLEGGNALPPMVAEGGNESSEDVPTAMALPISPQALVTQHQIAAQVPELAVVTTESAGGSTRSPQPALLSAGLNTFSGLLHQSISAEPDIQVDRSQPLERSTSAPIVSGQLSAFSRRIAQSTENPAPVVVPGEGSILSGSATLATSALTTEPPLASPLVQTETTFRPVGATAPQALALSIPLGDKGWDNALGEKILLMVGRSVQRASLQVSPPRLGPVEIQLSLQQDQASVSFTAHNGTAREALEAALPRLRELFNENNLQLVNVDVNQRQPGSSSGGGAMADDSGAPGEGTDDGTGSKVTDESQTPTRHAASATLRLLDDYA